MALPILAPMERRCRRRHRFNSEGLLHEGGLAGVKGDVVGAADEDSETIARGVFGKVFVGDGSVFLEPLRGSEFFESSGELAVHVAAGLLEGSGGDGIGEGAIWTRDVNLIEFRVETVAEAE